MAGLPLLVQLIALRSIMEKEEKRKEKIPYRIPTA